LASPEKKFEQVEDALEAMFADFSGAFIKCFFFVLFIQLLTKLCMAKR
jgi:hypothetical protein